MTKPRRRRPLSLAPLVSRYRPWPLVPALVAAVLVVALAAGACGTSRSNVEIPEAAATSSADGEEPPDPTPAADPADGAVTPAPSADGGADPGPAPPTAAQAAEITQTDCPPELAAAHLACALASVPVDPGNPSGPATEISLAVLQGTAPDPTPPLVVLQGGPGSASTDFRFLYGRRAYPQVFIDQRGTGFGSADFDCPEIDQILIQSLSMLSGEATAMGQAAYRACGDRLSGHPVLARTDSAAHAADVAAVMAGLGHDRWFVYGVSYGTTIALELMRAGPPGLAGAVLDGVYPPGLDLDRSLAASAESSLAELDEACAADPDCRDILADVDATLVTLMARLDGRRRPLTVTVDAARTGLGADVEVVIDGVTLAQMVFLFLYDPLSIVTIPGMLAGLEEGDEAVAARLGQDILDVSVIDSAFNAEGAYLAVQCAERLAQASGPPDDMGAYAAAIVGLGLAELCANWDLPPSAPAPPVVSDLPALLLAGRFDPITPPRLARQAAAGLSNSTVVVRDGASHGIWPRDPCAAALVKAFLADPAAGLDTSCAAAPTPLRWRRP